MRRPAFMRVPIWNGASTRPSCTISARNLPGRRRFILSASVLDAGFLAVSHGLDGTGADHVDLSGAVQSLSQKPRACLSGEEPQRLVLSSATAKWTNRNLRRADARVARKSRQSHLGRQLQSPASRWSRSRQRQNHSGTRSALPRRRLECHQSHLGLRLGSAAGEADKNGLLLKRMEEAVDGDYQKYSVEPGSYTRKAFLWQIPGTAGDGQSL